MAKHPLSILTLLALAIPGTGIAQEIVDFLPEDITAEDTEEIRYYSVEVIVFEYAGTVGAGEEIFDPEPLEDESLLQDAPADEDIPVYSDGTMENRAPSVDTGPGLAQDEFPRGPDLGPAIAEAVDIDADEIRELPSLTSIGYRLLLPEEMSMQKIHEKLLMLDAYRPLIWGGWMQAAVDDETSLPVQLRMLGTPPLNLSGELTLYLKNYLHVVANLYLEQQVVTAEPVYRQQQPAPGGRPRRKASADKYEFTVRERQVIKFVIEEDRIFNSGHLRYFDHPRFGALVRVNRVELPAEQPPDGDERADDAQAVAER